ncbi:MAG: anti-sigma factor [Synechococcales bacterium]|nr:anti-sigma factor [Synechococcales bacterium]
MTRSNVPDDWHNKLTDYVLNHLSPEDSAALQERVATDPELAQALAELQEAMSLLPYALPTTAPSPELKQRILQAARAKEANLAHLVPAAAAHAQEPSAPLLSERRLLSAWGGVGAIAALLVIALGVDNYRLRQQVSQSAQLRQRLQQQQTEIQQLQEKVRATTTVVASLQQPNAIVYTLEGTGPAAGATGRLVATPGHRKMVLVSENLPQLPEDQIYRLWSVADASAAPQYCGQFRNTPAGTVHWTAPDAACSATPTQVLITLDAPNDPIDSAGPLVMQSQT